MTANYMSIKCPHCRNRILFNVKYELRDDQDENTLSFREAEALDAILRNKTIKQTAKLMGRHPTTVSNYLFDALYKLSQRSKDIEALIPP